MRMKAGQIIAVILVLVAGPVLAGGGDWKMGPFGPYWDDNEWPEFTPMYWMEEFMNRLDSDDDDIQAWMLRNQYPGQYPATGLGGADPYYNGGYWPGVAQPYGGQQIYPPAYGWYGMPATAYPQYYATNPDSYWYGGEVPPAQSPLYSVDKPLPQLTLEEYLRMPEELQREYKREFERRHYGAAGQPVERYRYGSTLPRLTPEEYARMPANLQRQYRREYDRVYGQGTRLPGGTARRPLPNLTPQEYARMPKELQREYRRAFEQEYGDLLRRQRATRRQHYSGR